VASGWVKLRPLTYRPPTPEARDAHELRFLIQRVVLHRVAHRSAFPLPSLTVNASPNWLSYRRIDSTNVSMNAFM